MKCPYCGKKLVDTAKFCSACGKSVLIEQETPKTDETAEQEEISEQATVKEPEVPAVQPAQEIKAEEPKQKKKKKPIFKRVWFWILVVIAALLIAFGAMLANGNIEIVIDNSSSASDNEKEDYEREESEKDSDDENEKDGSEQEEKEDNKPEADEEDEETEEPESTTPSDELYYNEDLYDNNDNSDSDEFTWAPSEVEAEKIKLNEKIVVKNVVEFEIEEAYFADEIVPPKYTSDLPFTYKQYDKEGEKYIVLHGTAKNLSSEEIIMSNMEMEFIINNETTFKNYYTGEGLDVDYHQCCDVMSLDESGKCMYFASFEPDEKNDIYIFCSIPDEVYENAENCSVVFGFNEEFSSDAESGFDYCDYIYRFDFKVKD